MVGKDSKIRIIDQNVRLLNDGNRRLKQKELRVRGENKTNLYLILSRKLYNKILSNNKRMNKKF